MLCVKYVVRRFSQTGRVSMSSLLGHELAASADWHRPALDTLGSVCSRRFHQRTLEPAPQARSASEPQRSAVVAAPFIGCPNAIAFVQPVGGSAARTARLARICAAGPPTSRARDGHAERVSLACGSGWSASDPDWGWKRLRHEKPGHCEKAVENAPDGDAWFHANVREDEGKSARSCRFRQI